MKFAGRQPTNTSALCRHLRNHRAVMANHQSRRSLPIAKEGWRFGRKIRIADVDGATRWACPNRTRPRVNRISPRIAKSCMFVREPATVAPSNDTRVSLRHLRRNREAIRRVLLRKSSRGVPRAVFLLGHRLIGTSHPRSRADIDFETRLRVEFREQLQRRSRLGR